MNTNTVYTTIKGNQVTVDTDSKTIVSITDGKQFEYNGSRWTASQKGGKFDIMAFYIPAAKGYLALDIESSNRLEQAIKAKEAAAHEAYQHQLAAAVPGIEALRNAYAEDNAEYHRLREVIESGDSVFISSGKNHPEIIAALEAQYPRAAVWIEANDYENASHYAKAAAGGKAKKVLEDGGSIEDAEAILKNWTDSVYID